VFGEGIALHDDRIVQLTWKSERAFIWDANTMAAKGEYRYSGSGWGLCHDGQQFVMSDGTSTLQLRDSSTFELTDTIELDAAATPFRNFGLNELECVGDEVFANIYEYREIARISLSQRKVTAWIDTRNLLNHPDVPQEMLSGARDLNGIAHIPDSGHLLLTGKRWPRVFEVSLEPDELFR
jgi:glutamine cyclotransferase